MNSQDLAEHAQSILTTEGLACKVTVQRMRGERDDEHHLYFSLKEPQLRELQKRLSSLPKSVSPEAALVEIGRHRHTGGPVALNQDDTRKFLAALACPLDRQRGRLGRPRASKLTTRRQYQFQRSN